jgi:hypothetical protein
MTDPFENKVERQGEPDFLRRALLVALSTGSLAAASGSHAMRSGQLLPTGKATDFDFLRGSWSVHHRAFIQNRWQEFDGEVSSRPLVGGQSNVDDNLWTWNGQAHRGLAVRVFDPTTSRWSIFWLDGRAPERFGPAAVGGFTGGVGTFYGDEEWGGKAVRARLRWLLDGPDRARWEQAYSFDQEDTWELNWIMDFRRSAP